MEPSKTRRFTGILFLASCAVAAAFIVGLGVRGFIRARAAAVPVSGRTAIAVGYRESGEGEQLPAHRKPEARIAPDQDDVVLDAVDANLDDDEDLEQVISVRKAGLPNDPIRIVIADFRPDLGIWVRQWSGATRATNPLSLSLQVKDLSADGTIQLFCFGLDQENRQALTVIRSMKSSGRQGFSVSFSEAADRIEISDVSGTIETYRLAGPRARDDASRSGMLRTTYSWNPAEGKFSYRGQEFVAGEAMDRDLAAKVLAGDIAVLESFLRGLWVAESPPSGGREPNLIDFDTPGRKISFRDRGIQEVWSWSVSNPAPAGLIAAAVNESLPELLRLTEVQLLGEDRIRIRILDEQVLRLAGSNSLGGIYRRVRDQSGSATAATGKQDRPWTGSWMLPGGWIIDIGAARFRASGPWPREISGKHPARAESGSAPWGGVASFVLEGERILDLYPVGTEGRSYPPVRFQASVIAGPGGQDTLVLKPAVVGNRGITLPYAPELRFMRLAEDRFESTLQSAG